MGTIARLRGHLRQLVATRSPAGAEETPKGKGLWHRVWGVALPLLLAWALGWFAAVLLGVFLGGRTAAVSFTAASNNAGTTKERGLSGLDAFLTANPFRVSPQPVEETPQEVPVVAEVTGSLANAVLRGTLAGVGAWLEEDGKTRLVLIGTSFDVYTLEQVTYRSATFERGADRVVKDLIYTKGGEPKKSTTPSLSVAKAAPSIGGVMAAEPGGKDGQVPSELVNDLIQNPFDELKKVRLAPKEGQPGLEILAIQKDSILHRLGVQKGDVIKAVNGIAFNNMADIANSISSLINSDRFDVEVDRGGKTTALRYVVH